MSRPETTDRGPGPPRPPARGSRGARPAQSRRRTLSLAITLQALISAGDGLAMIALANRVFQSSHASWAVAVVFLAVTVPITALAPVAGVLLDRFPARPVLVTAALTEAVVALALSRVSSVGATLGLSVGFGICAAVLQPGLGAIVPRIAGYQGVTKANSYLQAATWGGFTVRPAAGRGAGHGRRLQPGAAGGRRALRARRGRTLAAAAGAQGARRRRRHRDRDLGRPAAGAAHHPAAGRLQLPAC